MVTPGIQMLIANPALSPIGPSRVQYFRPKFLRSHFGNPPSEDYPDAWEPREDSLEHLVQQIQTYQIQNHIASWRMHHLPGPKMVDPRESDPRDWYPQRRLPKPQNRIRRNKRRIRCAKLMFRKGFF